MSDPALRSRCATWFIARAPRVEAGVCLLSALIFFVYQAGASL